MTIERTKRHALAAALRAIVPPDKAEDIGDVYQRRLNDFQLGYLTGHARALRRASRPDADLSQPIDVEAAIRSQLREQAGPAVQAADRTFMDLFLRELP